MAIPDYQSIMLPLLKFAGDKKEHSIREAIEHISKLFNLSEDEKKELLPSGQQPIISNRTAWAKTYLKKAGLLDSTKRSYFKIAENGLAVLTFPERPASGGDWSNCFVNAPLTKETISKSCVEHTFGFANR